jgi:hypothetical protein
MYRTLMANQNQPARDAESTVPWHSLEQWRSTAFLIAGGLILGFVASNGVEAFTAAQPPTWVNTLFVAPALVAATVGLLGFYPLLTDQVPRLALASAAVVTVAGTAAIALFVVVTANGLIAGLQLPFLPIYFLTLLTTILGFVLVGVGSLWTSVPSRTVGLLVLGPPTVNIIMILTAPMNPPQWSAFLISAMWCGAVLAIGVALRSSSAILDRSNRSIDSTAR